MSEGKHTPGPWICYVSRHSPGHHDVMPALCLLGPADGKVVIGPDWVKLETIASIPASMFPEGDVQEITTVIYLKHTLAAGGREFDFYIPENASLADAFAALYDGYKPKETA